MKSRSLVLLIFIIAFHSTLSSQQFEKRDMTEMQWYKGNLHTHARAGESDTTVNYVIEWYMDHGYNFLVITDHKTITIPQKFWDSKDSSFIFIPGEEVQGYGSEEEVEINALNIHKIIQPLHNSTVLGALQDCIDAARQQGSIPSINHPNYNWRLKGDVLLNSRNCNLFELYNGFPGTNNKGDNKHPGLEEVWDFILTSGKRIYGIASDDAHVYKKFSAEFSNPGRGWVCVKAKSLDVNEIMQNLDSGLFYSSTGVEIEDFQVKPTQLEIFIKESNNNDYTTDFIGSGGKLLYRTNNNPAVYNLSTDGKYVRAKITATDGKCAWIQPVFIVR
jgi:hypothetical protein